MSTILIVEDHKIIAEAVKAALTGHIAISVETGAEALQALEKYSPEVVLLDLHLPDMIGLEIIETLKQKAKVIILTSEEHKAFVKTGVKHCTYLFKSHESIENVAEIIEALIRGEVNTRQYITQIVLSEGDGLTHREFDVYTWIKKGFSAKQIAAKLFLSVHYINNLTKSLLKKFGVNNSKELIAKF